MVVVQASAIPRECPTSWGHYQSAERRHTISFRHIEMVGYLSPLNGPPSSYGPCLAQRAPRGRRDRPEVSAQAACYAGFELTIYQARTRPTTSMEAAPDDLYLYPPIGMGRSLTAPLLPHRHTYGSRIRRFGIVNQRGLQQLVMSIHHSLLLAMFHCRLDELSELSIFLALFDVRHLMVFRLLEQLQITSVALFAQFSVFNPHQE